MENVIESKRASHNMRRGRLREKSNSLALHAANQCIDLAMCVHEVNTEKKKRNKQHVSSSKQLDCDCINPILNVTTSFVNALNCISITSR